MQPDRPKFLSGRLTIPCETAIIKVIAVSVVCTLTASFSKYSRWEYYTICADLLAVWLLTVRTCRRCSGGGTCIVGDFLFTWLLIICRSPCCHRIACKNRQAFCAVVSFGRGWLPFHFEVWNLQCRVRHQIACRRKIPRRSGCDLFGAAMCIL